MLTGEDAQSRNQKAEQAHGDDDRSGRKDINHGAGNGGSTGCVAAGHALAFAGAV